MISLSFERNVFEKKIKKLIQSYKLSNKNNYLISSDVISAIENLTSYEIVILISDLERKKKNNPKKWVNALEYMLNNNYFIFAENIKADVFLSHSTKDKYFVKKFMKDLVINKIKCWIDEEKLDVGDNLSFKIKNAIKNCKYFIVFWSSNSEKSIWVKREVEYAFEIQKKESIIILPVIIEDCNIPTSFKNILYADFIYSYEYAKSFKSILKIIKKKDQKSIFFVDDFEKAELYLKDVRLKEFPDILDLEKTFWKKVYRFIYYILIYCKYGITGNIYIKYIGEVNTWMNKYYPFYFPLVVKESESVVFFINQGFFKAFIESRDIVTGNILNKGNKYRGYYGRYLYEFLDGNSKGINYNDEFVIISSKKIINAINLNDGRLLWKRATSNFFSEVILIGNRILFTECLDKKNSYSRIICIDVENNIIFETGYEIYLKDFRSVYSYYNGTMLIQDNNIIYINKEKKELYIRSVVTGKVIYTISLNYDDTFLSSSKDYLLVGIKPIKDFLIYSYLHNYITYKFTLSHIEEIEEVWGCKLLDENNLSFDVIMDSAARLKKVIIDIESGNIIKPKELKGKNCIFDLDRKKVKFSPNKVKKKYKNIIYNLLGEIIPVVIGIIFLTLPYFILYFSSQYVEYLNDPFNYSLSYIFLVISIPILLGFILG